MRLDYSKTATPCQLIEALIPAIQGQLWLPTFGARWHARQHDGTWIQGNQHHQHHAVIHDAIFALPSEPKWNRFKSQFTRTAGLTRVLTWMRDAWAADLLAVPDDWPFPDLRGTYRSSFCACEQGCWDAMPLIRAPERSESVVVD